MSFIFTMRSAQSTGMFRRDPASVTSLQKIEEDTITSYDNPEPPPIPPRNRSRPNNGSSLGFEGSPPPPYNFKVARTQDPKNERLAEIRRDILNNKQIAKRGGWTRVCLIALVAILCIVGLVIGLVVGLKHHHSSSKSNSPNSGGASGTVPNPENPASSTAFPAGSYSFETYLSTVASNCTSNAATWMCYPYFTYSQSPLQSNATFQWIIDPVANSKNYVISSSANPFSITFNNVSLTLNQTGHPDEHYYFQTFIDKITVPTSQLGSDNIVAKCHFNQTTFQGYLYTKMPKSFPENSTTTNNTAAAFGPWPYAVKIEQIASSGTGEPTCLDPSGQPLGNFSIQNGGELCDCLYLNTGA